MQSVTSWIRRVARQMPQTPEQARVRQLRVGVVVYVVAALVAGAVTYVYLQPPGHRRVTFLIADAASVKPGTEVRIAGVPAGQVESVRLEQDAVRVELSVDSGIRLGDQSTVDIRMLTAVGGYYVNLTSRGSDSLGEKTIPAARARAPYSLPDLMADAAEKVSQINGAQLGANLDRLADALDANPGALGTIIDSVKAMAEVVDHQQDQLRTMLDASRELLHTTVSNKSMIAALVRDASILIAILDNNKQGLAGVGVGIGQLIDELVVATDFYQSHRDWLIDSLQRVNNALNVINTDIPRVIWNLGNFVNNLRNAVSPGGLRLLPELPTLATDMCVPIPGRTC